MRGKMIQILSRVLILGMLVVCGPASTAWGALANLGPSIAPHGYPAWYQDFNGLSVELCVPPPAGHATRADLCIFDPLELDANGNPINPLVLTGESFYWMASAFVAMPGGGDASIEFALEGTFGGTEEPVNGQQITFGRTRIRIDTPVTGTYTVTHPYGQDIFVVGDEDGDGVPDGINMTADIGSANFLFPELAFEGTLTAFGPDPVSLLTWPNYASNPDLQVRGPADPVTNEAGPLLEQYVGNPNVASTVVGGRNGNIFRVQGPGIDVQTDLFFVMGKVFDGTKPLPPHTWPPSPDPNLFAVGPVNRDGATGLATPLQPQGVRTGEEFDGYPLGYPLWYQEALTVFDEANQPQRQGGLKLTLCPPTDVTAAGDPMCIADPIDPNDQAMVNLRSGGENFWYIAEAILDFGDDSAIVTLAVEATFGGAEAIVDGQQIAFGRERIRLNFGDDLPAGTHTYRITHPYGVRILEMPANETRRDRIRFGSDIGITDLADPDGAFVGTLFSTIGPTFLKWTTFVDPSTLAEGVAYPVPELVTPHVDLLGNPTGRFNYHIGNPNIPHAVTGSPLGAEYNVFRVERLVSGTAENGNWALVAETNEFVLAGKVFDPLTFETQIVNVSAPVALPDTAALNLAQDASVTINVLANDTIGGLAVTPANVTVTVLPAGEAFGPEGGTVTVNVNGTITYTPAGAFVATGGVDTFGYQVRDNVTGLTSGTAVVTVTVTPVETITLSKARLDLRKLRWDIQGASNIDGTTLTIRAGGTASGPIIGTATVNRGRWSFRGAVQGNPNVSEITVVSPTGTVVTQPLQVR